MPFKSIKVITIMGILDTQNKHGFICRQTAPIEYSIWKVLNCTSLFRVVNELTGDTIFEVKNEDESDSDYIDRVGLILATRQLEMRLHTDAPYVATSSFWDTFESYEFLVSVPECRGMLTITPSIDKKFWKAEIRDYCYIGIGKSESEAIGIIEKRIDATSMYSKILR